MQYTIQVGTNDGEARPTYYLTELTDDGIRNACLTLSEQQVVEFLSKVHDVPLMDADWQDEDFLPNTPWENGRMCGLREAWEILVKVSHNGGSVTDAMQAVHWRMKEAE